MGVLCLFLAVACGYDYFKSRIPNYLIGVIGVFGIIRTLLLEGAQGILCYLITGILIIILFYPLFKIGSLGGGDIKLLGVVAGYLPWGKISTFLFLSLVVAAVISVIKLLSQNSLLERISYFCSYLSDVIEMRAWKMYIPSTEEAKKTGVCLSGPILVSTILYLGGFY